MGRYEGKRDGEQGREERERKRKRRREMEKERLWEVNE